MTPSGSRPPRTRNRPSGSGAKVEGVSASVGASRCARGQRYAGYSLVHEKGRHAAVLAYTTIVFPAGVSGREVSEMTIGQCRATWRHWRRPSTPSTGSRDLGPVLTEHGANFLPKKASRDAF